MSSRFDGSGRRDGTSRSLALLFAGTGTGTTLSLSNSVPGRERYCRYEIEGGGHRDHAGSFVVMAHMIVPFPCPHFDGKKISS